MDELIPILEQMAQKTLVDYLAIIAPLVLSVVAIVISISTTRKQNKIALFEKRYEAASQIATLLSFLKSIESIEVEGSLSANDEVRRAKIIDKVNFNFLMWNRVFCGGLSKDLDLNTNLILFHNKIKAIEESKESIQYLCTNPPKRNTTLIRSLMEYMTCIIEANCDHTKLLDENNLKILEKRYQEIMKEGPYLNQCIALFDKELKLK